LPVNNLTEPLPPVVAEATKQTFNSPPADADLAALKAFNDDFLRKNSQSPAHLQRGYNVRYHLDRSTKSQNETDLQKLLDTKGITLQQAAEGNKLLQEWGSDEKTVNAYREAAAKKWPQAAVFQKR
jgi:hypothetical protein